MKIAFYKLCIFVYAIVYVLRRFVCILMDITVYNIYFIVLDISSQFIFIFSSIGSH